MKKKKENSNVSGLKIIPLGGLEQIGMISFGPTLRGVHSPDEMMHIPAVEKFWNHLVLILEKVALE